MHLGKEKDQIHGFNAALKRYIHKACAGSRSFRVLDKMPDKIPAKLSAAIKDATLAPAGRMRPALCLCVAQSYKGYDEELAMAAALSVELIHCASLVHDDLPCFDDATTRRGWQSVQSRYGESMAVLTGDALIVMAFEGLIKAGTRSGRNLEVLGLLADSVGPWGGIIAGQAWEEESSVNLDEYHRAKTASLFEFAAMSGAVAAGVDCRPWREFGCAVGLAYQIADDLADEAGSYDKIGKPIGQDYTHRRPNAVHSNGIRGALAALEEALKRAREAVPDDCDAQVPAAWLLKLRHRMLDWFQDEPGTSDTSCLSESVPCKSCPEPLARNRST